MNCWTNVITFVGCWLAASLAFGHLLGRFIKRNEDRNAELQKEKLISKLRKYDFSEGNDAV